MTEDIHTAEFIDHFLWKAPVHTLLSHEFTLTPTKEIICISLHGHNPNNAKTFFNLTSRPLLDLQEGVIYEFDDATSEEKSVISKEKFRTYKEHKFSLASF